MRRRATEDLASAILPLAILSLQQQELKNQADFGIWAEDIGFLGFGCRAQRLQDVRNSDKSKFVTELHKKSSRVR